MPLRLARKDHDCHGKRAPAPAEAALSRVSFSCARDGVVHAILFELAGEPWWFVGKDLGDGCYAIIRRAS